MMLSHTENTSELKQVIIIINNVAQSSSLDKIQGAGHPNATLSRLVDISSQTAANKVKTDK